MYFDINSTIEEQVNLQLQQQHIITDGQAKPIVLPATGGHSIDLTLHKATTFFCNGYVIKGTLVGSTADSYTLINSSVCVDKVLPSYLITEELNVLKNQIIAIAQ